MKNKEQQIGELLANSVEDHFFNPAALGRYLAEQPAYTLDRVMEVVAWVIEKQARRYDRELENNGVISEGLALASKLDEIIDKIQAQNKFDNLKLPVTAGERKKFINSIPNENTSKYRYSWLHETSNQSNIPNINQGII
jgi:hypothetical protein